MAKITNGIKAIFKEPATVRNNRTKAFLFLVCYLVILGVCVLGLVQFLPKKMWWYGFGLSGSVATLLLTKYFVKKEGKPYPDEWLRPEWSSIARFFKGLFIGGVIIGIIVFLLCLLLGLKLTPEKNIHASEVIFWSLALIPCAFHEELGFRCYAFIRLQYGGFWKAQLIIALIFAAYHIMGGQDIANALLSTSLWSVLYAMAARYSNGIALSTGMHAGTNIGQVFFGIKQGEGFTGFYRLVPGAVTVANPQLIVLAVQAVVLGVSLFVFWLILRSAKKL